jgi:2-dehydropantoate 2-reductase
MALEHLISQSLDQHTVVWRLWICWIEVHHVSMVTSGDTLFSPRIAVIGSGAVGCYYAGRLAQHEGEVHFLMRSDLEQVKKGGLQIISPLGDAHVRPVNAYASTQEIGPCDLVIIALKATANSVLPELIRPLLKENTMLLTLQNGLGNEEFLAGHFGAGRVLGGLCFVCINRTAPGVIRHIAQGQISLGEFSGAASQRTHDVAAMFRRAGVEVLVTDSLVEARWRKLVWNIPFNGLSIVAGGIDTETILNRAPLEMLTRDLMREIITTANALGHAIPMEFIEEMIRRTRTMSRYRPSSLIDFLEGREVEVEPIWGEPLRRAREAGLTMPRLEVLHHLVKNAVEARST